ncbi:MAG TPA: sigma-54 dependent transcriptional regulator [Gemmatimonadales bacterium]|nr:sigma-54 dependent transcriptional regulator [Gemmatimonadales bacterium]
MPPKVYILDDDLSFAKLLAVNLRGAGTFKVEAFEQPEDLFARRAEEPPDAVVTDLVMPKMDGIAVTQRLRETDPYLPIFVLTGHADVATAIEALKAGATEYLTKPVNLDELTTLLKRALKERPLKETAESLEQTRKRDFSTGAILGADPKVEAVREFVRRVAAAPTATVLLLGESGTGKNLVAQAIHYSGAPGGRFVEINCAALPPHLLEAELFGHQKGAFTDARESKRGLVEVAENGTIFLDEIGELSPEFQAKLLNVLESRRFRRVGGTEELDVPARFVTATNRNLEEAVRAGRFREDLYYRIRVATMVLPPLREIDSDLPLLAEHFREFFSREFKKDVRRIESAALAKLRAWRWPGNVRELRNVIERAMIFADDGELRVEQLPPLELLAPTPETAQAGATLVDAEKAHIQRTLAAFDGNVQRAAEALGISRKNLWEKRKKYGLLE